MLELQKLLNSQHGTESTGQICLVSAALGFELCYAISPVRKCWVPGLLASGEAWGAACWRLGDDEDALRISEK